MREGLRVTTLAHDSINFIVKESKHRVRIKMREGGFAFVSKTLGTEIKDFLKKN